MTKVSRDIYRNQAGSWLDTPGKEALVCLGDVKERSHAEYFGILSKLVSRYME